MPNIGLAHRASGYLNYLTPRPFAALASPLPRVPRAPPRAVPPRAEGIPPRPAPPIRDAGAGVENFGGGLEDVGGLSTNDVSVVLRRLESLQNNTPERQYMKVVSPSISPLNLSEFVDLPANHLAVKPC